MEADGIEAFIDYEPTSFNRYNVYLVLHEGKKEIRRDVVWEAVSEKKVSENNYTSNPLPDIPISRERLKGELKKLNLENNSNLLDYFAKEPLKEKLDAYDDFLGFGVVLEHLVPYLKTNKIAKIGKINADGQLYDHLLGIYDELAKKKNVPKNRILSGNQRKIISKLVYDPNIHASDWWKSVYINLCGDERLKYTKK